MEHQDTVENIIEREPKMTNKLRKGSRRGSTTSVRLRPRLKFILPRLSLHQSTVRIRRRSQQWATHRRLSFLSVGPHSSRQNLLSQLSQFSSSQLNQASSSRRPDHFDPAKYEEATRFLVDAARCLRCRSRTAEETSEEKLSMSLALLKQLSLRSLPEQERLPTADPKPDSTAIVPWEPHKKGILRYVPPSGSSSHAFENSDSSSLRFERGTSDDSSEQRLFSWLPCQTRVIETDNKKQEDSSSPVQYRDRLHYCSSDQYFLPPAQERRFKYRKKELEKDIFGSSPPRTPFEPGELIFAAEERMLLRNSWSPRGQYVPRIDSLELPLQDAWRIGRQGCLARCSKMRNSRAQYVSIVLDGLEEHGTLRFYKGPELWASTTFMELCFAYWNGATRSVIIDSAQDARAPQLMVHDVPQSFFDAMLVCIRYSMMQHLVNRWRLRRALAQKFDDQQSMLKSFRNILIIQRDALLSHCTGDA